jgi:hypothetical protein
MTIEKIIFERFYMSCIGTAVTDIKVQIKNIYFESQYVLVFASGKKS